MTTAAPVEKFTGELWREGRGDRERIVAIEYIGRRPHSVVTELHWDHSRLPWFKPGRDKPNGTCPQHYDFSWVKNHRSLYWHNSGGGGELRYYVAQFVKPSPPPARLWVAPDVPIITYVGPKLKNRPCGDAELLRRGYKRIAKPLLLRDDYGKASYNPFDVAEEGQTIWCKYCKGDVLEDSCHPCDHMRWCDGCAAMIYVADRQWVQCDRSKCDCVEEE